MQYFFMNSNNCLGEREFFTCLIMRLTYEIGYPLTSIFAVDSFVKLSVLSAMQWKKLCQEEVERH
jgi:hypothetical protein